jgi:hypothetical protein
LPAGGWDWVEALLATAVPIQLCVDKSIRGHRGGT